MNQPKDLQEQINQLLETFINQTEITLSSKFLDEAGQVIEQLGTPVADDPTAKERYIYAEIIKLIRTKISGQPKSFEFNSLPAKTPVKVFGIAFFANQHEGLSCYYPMGYHLNEGDTFSAVTSFVPSFVNIS